MTRIPVLDHGYVELINVWGSDVRIVEAARMSVDKGFQGWGPPVIYTCERCGPIDKADTSFSISLGAVGGYAMGHNKCGSLVSSSPETGDEKLLRFLWKNHHETPFEMVGLTFEVMAPIFVFREWHRHRVPFGYNEMSARYTQLPDVNYIPSVERLMFDSDGKNKQAGTIKDALVLTERRAEYFQSELKALYAYAQVVYESALKAGISKELARIHLPISRYSRMRVTANLRGWLTFLRLRMDPAAQWEIRQFARIVGGFVAEHFPRTWLIFKDNALNLDEEIKPPSSP